MPSTWHSATLPSSRISPSPYFCFSSAFPPTSSGANGLSPEFSFGSGRALAPHSVGSHLLCPEGMLNGTFLFGAKSVFGMKLGQNSQNHLARFADVFALCSIRVKFQVSIQILKLLAILVPVPASIRKHQVGLGEIGLAEKSLTRASFRFIQPIDPQ